MRIAVTGANGFVGRAVLHAIAQHGHLAVPIVRQPAGLPGEVVSGDLAGDAIPIHALGTVDAVIHLAARTHVMHERDDNAAELYRRANVVATRRLLYAACASGARRFVFMSSIKAAGEWSRPGEPLSPSMIARPEDEYGRSKFAAESEVQDRCDAAAMEWTIIRPPLVYGPGVKGNLNVLAELIRKGFPLPFASVRNRRSMVSVANLADAAVTACSAPGAACRIVHVADLTASTPDLIRAIGASLDRDPRLLPFPPALMAWSGRLLGKRGLAERLLGSLELDVADSLAALAWSPPISPETALRSTFAGTIGGARELGGFQRRLYPLFKRMLDIGTALALAPIAAPLCLALLIVIRLETPGSPLFAQTRVGRHERPFRMLKLRTMHAGVGDHASHLVEQAQITRIGALLRRTKLDELPQLANILAGSMSLVGPRPCLPGQQELIAERRKRGIFAVRPGVTGLAQVKGFDMSEPLLLAEIERRSLVASSFLGDLKLIVRTAAGSGRGDAVRRRIG